jgi:hypothetical protein
MTRLDKGVFRARQYAGGRAATSTVDRGYQHVSTIESLCTDSTLEALCASK